MINVVELLIIILVSPFPRCEPEKLNHVLEVYEICYIKIKLLSTKYDLCENRN